jgi:glycosyltransferase involved in cell wall biosynthesis
MLVILRIVTVPLSFAKLLPGVVRFLNQNGCAVQMAGADGALVAGVEAREQARYHRLPLTRKLTLIADLNALWQTYRLIRRLRPQIVHTETPKAGLIGMLAARLAGVPVRIHTVAGLPLMQRRGWLRQLLIGIERLTYGCATHVYPNSAGLRQYIQTTFYDHPTKLRVLGRGSSNGVDTAWFCRTPALDAQAQTLRQTLGIGPDAFVWVFVGRLVRDKGINELVEAFAGLGSAGGSRLLLVGPFEDDLDPLLPRTRQQIEQRADILTTGYQDDIRPYLLVADALVFPSYREGFPNVPMQAACLEMPMILSDINGCNEIVTHEQNGLLVPPGNVNALKTAMHRLMTDVPLRQRLRQHTRQPMVDHYAQEQIWQHWLTAYKQHLSERGIQP